MSTETDKEKVWKRLKHVATPFLADMDVNSLYPWQADVMVGLERMEGDAKNVTIKVLKNRR